MADGSLTFVVPVRDPQGVQDWPEVLRLMAATFASLHRTGARIIVAATRGTDLPPLPPAAELVELDLPYLPLPSGHGERVWEAIRRDKGARVAAGLVAAQPQGHVMVVDHDDFVSDRLPDLVASSPGRPGWFVNTGYLYAGGSTVMRTKGFNHICGTSLITRADLLPIPTSLDRVDDALVARLLGSHRFLVGDLARMGTPLIPTPFPGAVYRIGHRSSSSPTSSIYRTYLGPRRAVRHPLRWMRHASGLRRTNSIRDEFALV